jgi:hypothetical protein
VWILALIGCPLDPRSIIFVIDRYLSLAGLVLLSYPLCAYHKVWQQRSTASHYCFCTIWECVFNYFPEQILYMRDELLQKGRILEEINMKVNINNQGPNQAWKWVFASLSGHHQTPTISNLIVNNSSDSSLSIVASQPLSLSLSLSIYIYIYIYIYKGWSYMEKTTKVSWVGFMVYLSKLNFFHE